MGQFGEKTLIFKKIFWPLLGQLQREELTTGPRVQRGRRIDRLSCNAIPGIRRAANSSGEVRVFSLILNLIRCVRQIGVVAASRRFGIPLEELRNLTRFKALYGVASLQYILRQPKGLALHDGKSRWQGPDNLEGIASLAADGRPPDGIACDWDTGAPEYQAHTWKEISEAGVSPAEDNQLLQDIARLDDLVNDHAVAASARVGATKLRDFLKRENARIEFISEIAEITGIRALFEPLPDSELAKWISEILEKDGKDGPFGFVYSLGEDHPELAQAPDFLDTTRELLLDLFTAGLVNESGRRRSQHETEDGRALSKLVVEMHDRNRILSDLGKRTARGLWFHGETPGHSTEAPSMAQLLIWEALAKLFPEEVLFNDRIPATEPKFLEALMGGAFNKTLKQARDHIRTAIETEVRRSEQLEYDSDAVESYKGTTDQTLLPNDYPTEGNWESAAQQKILLEQVKSKAGLDEADQKIVELRIQGHTQEDIADDLSVTQVTVSNRLRSIMKKMRTVIERDQKSSH